MNAKPRQKGAALAVVALLSENAIEPVGAGAGGGGGGGGGVGVGAGAGGVCAGPGDGAGGVPGPSLEASELLPQALSESPLSANPKRRNWRRLISSIVQIPVVECSVEGWNVNKVSHGSSNVLA
ncbi:hypothetical protein [Scleromatobacter humisilvae]|uniref:Uncharacterized protein n=1 Tax=Scleromatobacter humisilvae TaxID=2897159 RepID=A0A9X1YHC9_9BURK|nr:hypothetical protein [Scleromatobacter humisilvae]MCK9686354.1 hypothetical protein [Scleromatobacter humisilvae]